MSEHHYWIVDYVEYILGYTMEHLYAGLALMVTTTGGWFSKLSEGSRNFIAVMTLLAAGFTAGVLAVNFTKLPEQVAINTAKNAEIAENIENLGHRIQEFEGDVDYLVRLSTWSLCAIRYHDQRGTNAGVESLVAVCGREPTPNRYYIMETEQ